MFVGSFEGDLDEFQTDVVSAINQFKASGVSQVLIDLTNNGGKLEVIVVFQILHSDVPIIGGFVCLGQFLHQYLAGAKFGYPYVYLSIALCTQNGLTNFL